MTRATTLVASVDLPCQLSDALDSSSSVHQLGDAIAEIAARLHAATYELLVLLRQFDARAGWNNGFLSCAHWLHWRTGIDLGAAREKVRVAKALATLPRLSAAMQCGEVSYAKVRAVTRVATPDNEAQLVDVAHAGTAAHVERLVRAWRRVDRVEAARQTEARHLERHLTTWVDEDGMVVLRGRLTPEVGAVVQRALEAAANRLFHESAQVPSGGTIVEEVTAGQRRADALGLLAESALAADLDRGTAGDRYQVVLHVEAGGGATDAHADTAVAGGGVPTDTSWTGGGQTVSQRGHGARSVSSETYDVAYEANADGGVRPAPVPCGVEPCTGHAVVEVGDGATYVSVETYERIACDASVVVMRHDTDGSVLDVGRKTRSIPPAIRRALTARDPQCQYPGCTARRCDAHHVTPWAHGGRTSLENLLHLCRSHHRAVHEGGYRITRDASGDIRVMRPDGTPLLAVPPRPHWTERQVRLRPVGDQCEDPLGPTAARLAAAGRAIGPYTATPTTWDGHPFDVVWAIDVLRRRPGAALATSWHCGHEMPPEDVSAETSPDAA